MIILTADRFLMDKFIFPTFKMKSRAIWKAGIICEQELFLINLHVMYVFNLVYPLTSCRRGVSSAGSCMGVTAFTLFFIRKQCRQDR